MFASSDAHLAVKAYFENRQVPVPAFGKEVHRMQHQSRPDAKVFPSIIFPCTANDGTIKGIQAIRFESKSINTTEPRRLSKSSKVITGSAKGALNRSHFIRIL
jgi:hypothetical protein